MKDMKEGIYMENMNIQTIATDKAPAAIGPYSQGKISGDLVFSSGQIPLDAKTGEICGATIQEQTEQVIQNLEAVLEAAGASLATVIKTTCFLADMDDFAHFNDVYAKHFTSQTGTVVCRCKNAS